jgi:hypothetical protein
VEHRGRLGGSGADVSLLLCSQRLRTYGEQEPSLQRVLSLAKASRMSACLRDSRILGSSLEYVTTKYSTYV